MIYPCSSVVTNRVILPTRNTPYNPLELFFTNIFIQLLYLCCTLFLLLIKVAKKIWSKDRNKESVY